MTEERFEELECCVDSAPKGRWLVFSHDNPDPDALVSTALLGRLLERRFRRKVTLAYAGIIGRAENREMCRALGLKLQPLRELDLRSYACFALVDTQPGTGNNRLPDDVVPTVVIDHHPRRKTTAGVPFVDIREDYGATASILAEYLTRAEVAITRRAATGIVYAIQSETQFFSRESSGPDRRLFDHFYTLANKRALGRIQFPRLPLHYFRTLSQALDSLEENSTFVACHLPEVETPDIVPEVADLLLRLEGKTWCLATGLYEDRVFLAIRTSNTRADAGRAMRRILGRKGRGGGHRMIAGGWFPLDGKRENASAIQHRLAEKLLRILKKDPARLRPLRLR